MDNSTNSQARSPQLINAIQGRSGFLSRFGLVLMIGILSLLVILSVLVKYPRTIVVEASFVDAEVIKSDPKVISDSCLKTATIQIPVSGTQFRAGEIVQVTVDKYSFGHKNIKGVVRLVSKIDKNWNRYDIALSLAKSSVDSILCSLDSIPARISFVSEDDNLLSRIWASVRKRKSF